MKKENIYLVSLLLILLVSGVVSAEQINSCRVLDKPNTLYSLSKNIVQSGKGDCIKITAENITLDCQNNSIIGSKGSSGVFSNSPRTKIKNCYIREFEEGYGIYLKNSDSSTISDNIIKKNNLGIAMNSSKNTRIAYNIVESNEAGIEIEGENNIINNNDICFNKINDVFCTNNQSFENNRCDSERICGGACFSCTSEKHIVYECREFKEPDTIYELETDIELGVPGSCFNIYARNVTLDCKGHKIIYNLKLINPGGEFLIYSKNNYTTIKNCFFQGISSDLRYTGEIIKITDSSYSNIINNNFNKIKEGIFLENSCKECLVEKNEFNAVERNAINIQNADKNIVKDNRILAVGLTSIKILGGSNSEIKNNYIEDSKNSIEIENPHSTIEKNTILNTRSTAVTLKNSEESLVIDNEIENSGLNGIHIQEEGGSGILIRENNIYSSSTGILIENGENIKIIENTVGGSQVGFKEEGSSLLRIDKNIICGNNEDVVCSSKHQFNDNQCSSGKVCGECNRCGLSSISLWETIKQFFRNLF